MANQDTINASHTINGSFGSLSIEGEEIANIMSVEGRAILNRRDIRLAGSRRTGYKAMDVRGEGTFTIYYMTSEFTRHARSMFRARGSASNLPDLHNLTMSISLDDPEIIGEQSEELELYHVKLWEIPFGFSVDDLVTRAIPFTFEDWDVPEEITARIFTDNSPPSGGGDPNAGLT